MWEIKLKSISAHDLVKVGCLCEWEHVRKHVERIELVM